MDMMKMFHRHQSDEQGNQASRALGVASIAIGLAEILMPRQIQNMMGLSNGRSGNGQSANGRSGVNQNTGILRVLGVREICHGIDLLSHDDPGPGLWGRVAGDMLDGALLGMAARQTRRPGGLMAAFAMVAPIVLADLVFAKRCSDRDCSD